MKILVTGCAGFIGYHLCSKLLENKDLKIYGIDNLNNYYSVKLKKTRLNNLKLKKNFFFNKLNIVNFKKLETMFKKNKFKIVVNLAAQAGVRYSVVNPKEYVETNIMGFSNILELCRNYNVKEVYYASSSSVYGDQKKFPVKENVNLIPKNIYSLSKKNNEDIAQIYNNYYGLNAVGLRFFTVYGEWGRPDMLMLKYLLSFKKNKEFVLNNDGNHFRDFTYIRDVINILVKLIFLKKQKDNVYNICSNKPESVKKILNKLDELYGKPKIKKQKKLSIEVLKTHGSNFKIKKIIKFKKFTNLDQGLENLVLWAKDYLNKI